LRGWLVGPLRTTTRVSSACVESINISLDIKWVSGAHLPDRGDR
jgi:hypothetical protein